MHATMSSALAALLFASSALAQTYTSCNPLNATCPSETALGTSAMFNWTQVEANPAVWNTTLDVINFAPGGAEFSIGQQGDAPTIQSIFYIMWGRVSVVMKAAPGQGIVSSVVMESSDLDEIDWEFIGGNSTHVQTNFFGKGDTSTYDRAVWYPVANTLDFHNYTTVWTQDVLQWWIDGVMVRNLTFDDPLAMTHNASLNPQPGDRYPQTPMTIRIGNWAGGDPDKNSPGTVQWAGGDVNYKNGPFVQVVQSVEVVDFTHASTYTYTDHSGKFESIQASSGNSTVAAIISKPPPFHMKWSNLSRTAQIGIISGVGAFAAILAVGMAVCCIKNRRAGRKERAIADAEWERNLTELQRYKHMMSSEQEIHPRAGYI